MIKQPLKLLIVEDEVISAMALKIEFRQFGYEILRPVTTGEDAVKSARIDSPDVILMDIRLAGIKDGIQAAKDIRSFSKCLIVFMTGYEDEELMKKAQEVEYSRYFIKPIVVNDLHTLINQLLW
jgi:Response regulator containing CheY-like receiver domain and AraC-type DNA-binding domain